MHDIVELAKPKFFDKVFSDEAREILYAFLQQPGWETGWKSNNRRDPYTFLHKHFAGHRKAGDPAYNCEAELRANAPIVWGAWSNVNDTIFKDHKLVRCYANALVYGMDGTIHTDANEPGNYTAVYYPHKAWSPNWGGETIFYNRQETGIIGCAFPRPNSAIMFDGRMPHRAAGVTRIYPGLRITLMFKTESNVVLDFCDGRQA